MWLFFNMTLWQNFGMKADPRFNIMPSCKAGLSHLCQQRRTAGYPGYTRRVQKETKLYFFRMVPTGRFESFLVTEYFQSITLCTRKEKLLVSQWLIYFGGTTWVTQLPNGNAQFGKCSGQLTEQPTVWVQTCHALGSPAWISEVQFSNFKHWLLFFWTCLNELNLCNQLVTFNWCLHGELEHDCSIETAQN